MRITTNMTVQRSLRDMEHNQMKMDKYHSDLMSEQNIHRPSDDPIRAARAMRYRGSIAMNQQYVSNLEASRSWLEATDTSLDKVTKKIQDIIELTTRAASGTNGADIHKIADEISQIRQGLVQDANESLMGRSLYTGFQSDQPLVKLQGDTPKYNIPPLDFDKLGKEKIYHNISDTQQIFVNVTGDQVFGMPSEEERVNLFSAVGKILQTVRDAGDPPTAQTSQALSQQIEVMQGHLKKVLAVRGEVGAKVKLTEMMQDKMKDFTLSLQAMESYNIGTNIPETYTKMISMESTYRASLAISAKIIQPSLVDFLR